MQKTKILITITTTLLLFLVIIVSSCSKDDFTNKEQEKILNSEINLRDYTPSLFGQNKIVPIQVAHSIAERINMTIPEAITAGTLSGIRSVDSLFCISDNMGVPVMYIANYIDDGFSVISADERHAPIIAIVEKGKYGHIEVPSMLLDWFDLTFENIQYARLMEDKNSNYIEDWLKIIKDIDKNEYLIVDDCCRECPNYPDCLELPTIGCGAPDILCDGGHNEDPCAPYTITTKGPLMTTNWSQGCTYNEECPDKDCDDVCFSNENAWTGCVATAMAQVLKYWSHLCSQDYNYETMLNNSGNSEVQRMMRDVGDAVDMDYGCNGSGADGDKADNAFKDIFCFDFADRNSYNSSSYQVVVQDINADRPVLLDGCRTRKRKFPWLWYTYSNCHMWVCDGYQRHQNSCYSILKFHMNWGWGGSFNGWYYYNLWNPGTSNYQYAQDFTHNIHP